MTASAPRPEVVPPETPIPMDFDLGEETREVLGLAERFGEGLRRGAREAEARDGLAPETVSAYSGLGLERLHWGEAAGGAGLGLRLKTLVLERLGHADAAAALALDRRAWVLTPLVTLGGGPRADLEAASPALHLDPGECLGLRDGRLGGSIPYLPAARADLLLVLRGRVLHALRSGLDLEAVAPGALHAAGASRLALDAPVAWSRELEPAVAWWVGASWRFPLAALLAGLARASYEYARAYCLERVVFGRPVAHHQAVAFIFADMAMAVETAGLCLEEAAVRAEALGPGAPSAAALDRAWLQASEAALYCTNHGVQLVGGAGYMRDHPVEKWMREARALSLLAGGPDAALEALAGAALTRASAMGEGAA
ncbi:MAG: acyl-CoA dehydrogenase [Planctomycetes bacterium]|nr:acyl-CoA dehydrogenase [Planctomycetota bacterium]